MCKLKIGLCRQYSTLSPSSTNPHMGSEAGSNSGTLRHIQTACKIKINSTSSVRLLHSLALAPFFFAYTQVKASTMIGLHYFRSKSDLLYLRGQNPPCCEQPIDQEIL